MQIVIDISEEEYEVCKRQWDTECLDTLMIAVKYGTPLPKNHGKLVDLDQMCQDYWNGNYMEIHFNDLDNIKTIIEADKTESEVEK